MQVARGIAAGVVAASSLFAGLTLSAQQASADPPCSIYDVTKFQGSDGQYYARAQNCSLYGANMRVIFTDQTSSYCQWVPGKAFRSWDIARSKEPYRTSVCS